MHKFRLKNNCITVIHVKMVNMNRKKLILRILRSDFTKTLEIFKRKLTFFYIVVYLFVESKKLLETGSFIVSLLKHYSASVHSTLE